MARRFSRRDRGAGLPLPVVSAAVRIADDASGRDDGGLQENEGVVQGVAVVILVGLAG